MPVGRENLRCGRSLAQYGDSHPARRNFYCERKLYLPHIFLGPKFKCVVSHILANSELLGGCEYICLLVGPIKERNHIVVSQYGISNREIPYRKHRKMRINGHRAHIRHRESLLKDFHFFRIDPRELVAKKCKLAGKRDNRSLDPCSLDRQILYEDGVGVGNHRYVVRKYLVDRALCLIENILPLNWHIGVYDIRACARHFSVRGFRSRGVPLACEENSIVANTLPECNHAQFKWVRA